MSKRIRLSLSAQEKQSTDWSKCFICQEDKHEALKSPPMKIDLAKSGYRTLSKNISEFAKINEMPIPLDIRRIDTRLHQCAQNLQDQKYLAKLSAGDVVAQELIPF